ncbi:mynd finger family protein [Colletotrichum kahawae]|uniref:Mynd finger family protein n=1 Tax=Colletotrichum kahawae TaxID=34407 RepID=A0AAE0D0T1_COLKA|nr:mynd finger family protein [Colletotrichum kahawae]
MLTPTVANSISFFYPVGNTPAVNLARGLPHGVDANLLLLGCGDVRNILHTAYNEVGLRTVTCPMALSATTDRLEARDILLFSLLLDNAAAGNTAWNLFYDLRISKADTQLLSNQLEKLLAASKSFNSWKVSSYGKAFPFVDGATFDDVRAIWKMCFDAASADDRAGQEASLKAAIKRSLEIRKVVMGGEGQSLTGMRSAAPLSTGNFEAVTNATDAYFDTSKPNHGWSGDIPNPMFTAPLSKHRVLHHGADPILGFHLATAFAALTDASPLKPNPKDGPLMAFAAAKNQFREWGTACGKLLRDKKLVIRFVASEALAFCQTLQHFISSKETSAGWYRRQFDSRPFCLDPEAYGGKLAAPSSFDAIDTSNLADHVGTINLLTSALPLLTPQPWSSVFTETLLKREDTSKEGFDRILYGHGPPVSLLLGASAVEYWTNTTAVSWVDEMLISFMAGTLQDKKDVATQLHTRINWKQSKFFSGVDATGPLQVDPEALAGLLFKLYLEIFAHENPMKLLSISKASMAQLIRNTAYTNFHRGTLVSLMRYLKLRLSVSDFDRTVNLFLEKYSFERSLMFTGNLRQDFSLQMHIQGLFSEPWLQRDIKPNRNLGGFDSWESIPEVVAVTLVVPNDAIKRLFTGPHQAEIASPTVRGSLVSGKDADHKWHNFFDDVQLVWGTVKPSGDRESSNDFSVTIEPDTAGWAGNSPLIASFYVPSSALQLERKTAFVRLEVQSSAQNVAVYQKTLGQDLKVHESKLADESSVFITKYLPGQTRYPATCEAAGAVAESATEAKGETQAVFTANMTAEQDRIATVTGHLDFLSAKGKKLLTDKVPIETEQVTPFTVNVVFGKKHYIYPITFPIAVDASEGKVKIRIARKSSYVEVIAPIAAPATGGGVESPLVDFTFPTTLAKSLSYTPVDFNTPHFNLDRLPIIDITKKAANRWMVNMIACHFSVGEKKVREQAQAGRGNGISRSTRLNFKESVFTMFMLASGLQGGQTGLMCLSHASDETGVHMLILVSAVRLDPASGSVVLDAAVIPFTEKMIHELEPFLLMLRELECAQISVDDAELTLWRKVLPSLAERTRTWNHKSSCEYRKTGKVPVSTETGKQVLCSCGHGKLPDNFVALPEWESASKYATRIAISPTFAVPFVDDCVDFETWGKRGGGRQQQVERCRACGKSEAESGTKLKKCTRCLQVKYCSAECQKKDWRKHRAECAESDIHAKLEAPDVD